MLNIIIYSKKMERAETLFKLSAKIVRSLAIKCKVSYFIDFQAVNRNITEDIYRYDVLILDALSIESAKIAEKIREKNLMSSIIFAMSGSSVAFPVLKYRPSALLSSYNNVAQLSEALKYISKEYIRLNPYLVVKNKDRIIRIHYEHILYLESNQRVVTLHCNNQKINFYAKLADVQSVLPADKFIRCHQSYLVNVDMLTELDKRNRQLHLITGEIIEISKSYYTQIQSYFCNTFCRQ